ncbi:hypothetical protein DRN86_05500 [Candidatus Geothermarchaeota archaeon]|nr:MAG: hypothetical protein DRN86_05500 [Candidatus Geothermarchaeota archaeon]
MSFFDLCVLYNNLIEKTLKRLRSLGFKYVGISFSFDDRNLIREVKELGKEFGLEIFSRVDIEVNDPGQYHRLASKARRFFDLICVSKAPVNLLKGINLKKIALIDALVASPRLVGKIRSMGMRIAVEFNFSKFFKALRAKSSFKVEGMIRNVTMLDSLNMPIVISSGAEDPFEVIPPVQMVHTFSAIIGKREVNKKYISTIPQALIRNLMPLRWDVEGI